MLTSIYNIIVDILFPLRCISCKKNGSYICDDCIPPPNRREIESLENIDACFDYRNPIIKKMIWDLKYYNKRSAGAVLGRHLYEYVQEEISDLHILHRGEPFIVIPVPLSRERHRERGYNQAEYIARGFVNANPNIFVLNTDIVVKQINTGPQARINNKKRRLKNIKGAFKLKDGANVKNKIIFVVDDVTTTGGTLSEIIHILKKAGAREIRGLAVAH
ncbi:MAG: ComF family protein [Candidatus Pacebacteria bacterium]|nr:ComF family protein [Candidatus Paceibacterota bacterium]MBP9715893.1 ComF family protein [Candidatus Paceibacterota bacterium]